MCDQRQTCKSCGRPDKFDFYVNDEIWISVVPDELKSKVVCLFCFDNFAYEKGIEYKNTINTLYFAGDAANLIFEKVN